MIRVCTACGASNRIPAKHLTSKGKCGTCKAALPPQSTPIDVLDSATFDAIVTSSPWPILVDFWAAWCGPCRMAAPEVAKTAESMSGKALVLKVDTEAIPELSQRYNVQGIPNFIVFRDSKVAFQQAGLVKADTMMGWLS